MLFSLLLILTLQITFIRCNVNDPDSGRLKKLEQIRILIFYLWSYFFSRNTFPILFGKVQNLNFDILFMVIFYFYKYISNIIRESSEFNIVTKIESEKYGDSLVENYSINTIAFRISEQGAVEVVIVYGSRIYNYLCNQCLSPLKL